MDPGPTISRPYTRHKWVGRMICSEAIVSARAQDFLRLPESMTIIKNRTDNVRFSFPLIYTVAQNATSVAVGNVSGCSATSSSSSSCGSGSTASSCYDVGYQNALANPGKTCPSGHSYSYCAGWAHAREKR
jgi:hypothetical protein